MGGLGSTMSAPVVSDEEALRCQQLHLNIETCAVQPDVVLKTGLPEVCLRDRRKGQQALKHHDSAQLRLCCVLSACARPGHLVRS